MYTKTAKEPKNRSWVLVDLDGQTLGRIATKIANILRGKHRPTFSPNVDTGDYVVAINASKIKLTGKKLDDKMYYWHSRYMGGLRELNARELLDRKPEELVQRAVEGMLLHNTLSKKIMKKFKVYPGKDHPHTAHISPKIENKEEK